MFLEQPFLHSLARPGPLVFHKIFLGAVKQQQTRKALHPERFRELLFDRGIAFGDRDLVGERFLLAELLPHRSELLAVAAPGRVELHEK